MAKDKSSDALEVTTHILKLDPSIRDTIEIIRQSILSVDKEIAEHIKWNNPSFYYSGKMKPFDPKAYKRDMIVMNLHKNRIMLVFPSGAKVNDATGLLTGDFKDGRRIVVFSDLADFMKKEAHLKTIIKEWLILVE
ncbi:MAG: DUF1801 domain-containing protein [Saprospiraceae bacterium]